MDTGFDFADLVDEAVARSGGEATTAADILKIRRGFRILTERWTAQGFNTWRVNQHVVGLSGSSRYVTLPECVDDVFQVMAITGGTKTETAMRRISASEYAQLTAKDTLGRPSQWWLQRDTPPKVHIFPIGHKTVDDTLVVYSVDRPDAFERYDPVDDVPGRWLEALTIGLALDLARKRPPLDEGLIQRLKMESAEAEAIAQAADRDRANYRMRISI